MEQVNGICKQFHRQGKKQLNQVRPTGDPLRDLIRKSSLFAKLIGKSANRIEAVEPAIEDQTAVASWIAGIRREKRLIDRFVQLLKHRKFSGVQRVTRKYDHVRRATDAKARKLGVSACVSSTR